MHLSFHVRSRRGSALLLVFWSLILLSMCVFGVVEIVETSVTHASHLELASQARALALSGLAVAQAPDMPANDSLLQRKVAPDQSWNVRLLGEGGRLNLDQVLVSKHREILSRLFQQWGLDPSQAGHVADCLNDWVSPDDKASPQGAKAVDYKRAALAHLPTGKPFASLEEVAFVMGMDAVAKAKPDWQKSFTLWSEGPLDVNEAPPDLLAAVFNLPLTQTRAFVERRNGKDGLVGTPDDVTVANVAALRAALGLSETDASKLTAQFSFDDNVRRIESRGAAGGVTVTVSAITRLNTQPPEYLSWSEL